MAKIEDFYKKYNSHLAPIGSYVICTLPFFFLYQYAKENILIEETIYIALVVALAAILNCYNSGLCFVPVCGIFFLALWDKNVVLASLVTFLAFLGCIYAGDNRKGQYVYPIIILIFTGCLNRSLLPLMLAYTLSALVFWRDDSSYAFVIPLCLAVNIYIYGSGTELKTIELNSFLSERLPFNTYFKTVLDKLNGDELIPQMFDLLKQQYKFYVLFFVVLWVGTMLYRGFSSRFDKYGKPLAFTLLSCLLSVAMFSVAHASAQIVIGYTPDYQNYLKLSALCLLISVVLSLFIKIKIKPKKATSSDYKVFISYSHRDLDVAKQVCATLENEGIACWYAPRNIPAGEEWASAIMNAIKKAKVMVVIFSNFSNSSVQVMREIDNAISNGVTVIPLKLTRSNPSGSMEYYLSTLHWFDASSRDLEIAVEDMSRTIKKIVESEDE